MDNYDDLMDQAVAELKARGFEIPEVLKRRDPREPRRKDKMRLEDKLMGLFHRHFKKQMDMLIERIGWQTGRKDAGIDDLLLDFEDEEFTAKVIRVLTIGAYGGVSLFEEQIRIGMDYTLTNDKAATWARNYAYDLIKDINSTSQKLVSSAVNDFIQTPGMTMGDLKQRLAPTFGDVRANRIAVTETTRAYAQGWKQAGQDLKETYPDARTVKTWFTNNDDLVCEICGPLDGLTVDFDDDFPGAGGEPPAHVNCRCWSTASVELPE